MMPLNAIRHHADRDLRAAAIKLKGACERLEDRPRQATQLTPRGRFDQRHASDSADVDFTTERGPVQDGKTASQARIPRDERASGWVSSDRCNLAEGCAHERWHFQRSPCDTVDVNVDEVALRSCEGIIIAEQADFVSHAGPSQLCHA